jgi:hypothetical protein
MTQKLNAWRFNNYLNDSTKSGGGIIQFGLKNYEAFENLIKEGMRSSKPVYGYDDFKTMSLTSFENKLQSTQLDGWNVLVGHTVLDVVELKEEFCFAFINSDDATLVNTVLENIWPLMSYGSTLFFPSYNNRGGRPIDRIIKRFLTSRNAEITPARQMLIGGIRETNLAVKCYPVSKKPPNKLAEGVITIATVFKSGGEYNASYVNHIANSIHKYVTVPYKFVCLTDVFEGYGPNVQHVVPFENNFPKWWGKIELFKPNKFNTDRVFYLDLDTFIVDNINHIVQYGGKFFGLRDFYHQYGLGSGLMCWRSDDPIIHQIYEKFMESPQANMNNHRWGDQEFIGKVLPNYMEYVQDLYPKEIISYKKDCLDQRSNVTIPPKSRIICFHGPPRPHNVRDHNIKKYWMG